VTDQPVDDAAIANPYYRKAFDDLSLGTEEEFSAAKIKVRLAAGQLIGVISKADQPLVLITSDLRDRVEGDYGVYTIELRTTPTETAGRSAAGPGRSSSLRLKRTTATRCLAWTPMATP